MKHLFMTILVLITLQSPALAFDRTPPSLDTNPSLDVIVTRTTPLLSFKNNSEGVKQYQLELDLNKSFNSPALIRYEIDSGSSEVVSLQIPDNSPLKDQTIYWWRVRAISKEGDTGNWAVSRFYVNTTSDDQYSGLQRVTPVAVQTGSGSNPEYLTDYSDAGLKSQWRAAPPGPQTEWVQLDLGKPVPVSRIWLLSDFENRDGWLKQYHWLKSQDGQKWTKVTAGEMNDINSYRIIQDIPTQKARFWRLIITEYTGYAPALNEIMLFTPAEPEIPNIPEGRYIIVVGNQRNGGTFTRLSERLEELQPNINVVQIPFWKVNMEMIKNMPRKPSAIILSGNNADYNNLPMFEYNGEYEIIRKADIPIFGICAGCQMNAFAYGYTRVHTMGWADISAIQKPEDRTKIDKLLVDDLFKDTPEQFTAPEVHGWAIYSLPDNYQTIAASTYIQAIRRKDKLRYGVQFHPEIKESYNQAETVLSNFINWVLHK